MKYRALSSIFYSDNSKYLKIYENRYNSESTYYKYYFSICYLNSVYTNMLYYMKFNTYLYYYLGIYTPSL